MSHPHWFTYPSRLKYRRWMRVCTALPMVSCVSPEVAGQLETVMTTRYGRRDLPEIVTITPGSDIAPDTMPGDIVHLPQAPGLDATAFGQAVLIVGTLEPRKGHADALAAFELLWREARPSRSY
jgi:glycosyltransferase involved in cell wall biosynthesis